jgi:histidine triad (HIT) family protein
MSDCLFCKIVNGDIPAKKVYEDEHILVFHDIAPKAKVHVLVIPKKHIATLADATEADQELLGYINVKIPVIAKELGLDSGFRTIINTGHGGGQEVFHMHYHVLGGSPMPFV